MLSMSWQARTGRLHVLLHVGDDICVCSSNARGCQQPAWPAMHLPAEVTTTCWSADCCVLVVALYGGSMYILDCARQVALPVAVPVLVPEVKRCIGTSMCEDNRRVALVFRKFGSYQYSSVLVIVDCSTGLPVQAIDSTGMLSISYNDVEFNKLACWLGHDAVLVPIAQQISGAFQVMDLGLLSLIDASCTPLGFKLPEACNFEHCNRVDEMLISPCGRHAAVFFWRDYDRACRDGFVLHLQQGAVLILSVAQADNSYSVHDVISVVALQQMACFLRS